MILINAYAHLAIAIEHAKSKASQIDHYANLRKTLDADLQLLAFTNNPGK